MSEARPRTTLFPLLLCLLLSLPSHAPAAPAPPLGPQAAFLALPPAPPVSPAASFALPAGILLPAMARPQTSLLPLVLFSAEAIGGVPGSMAWIWNRAADPSLHLSNWLDVLNVARLGAYAVPLRDDPAERTNILLAAQAVDNCVILPGQTFSFNTAVGERTPQRGYADGLMFDQGQIVRGTGGGICLVSTGLYNAALQAGLPITERHGHSGVVSYAAPGCDASVVFGAEDMQFVNTTFQPITVKTTIGINQVLVSLYGTPPPAGQHVFIKTQSLSYLAAPSHQTVDPSLPPGSAPVVDQKPRSGYHVVVVRQWTRHGHVVRQETVADETRAPRPQIVRIAPPPQATVAPVPSVQPLGEPEKQKSIPPAPSVQPLGAAPQAPPPQVWGAGKREDN